VESLEGIAAADAHLGRRVPLPGVPLPLARWVEVRACGPGAVEVEWNLDDTRSGAPGRLALYAGERAPAPRDALGAVAALGGYEHRGAELVEAMPSLRPVHELRWTAGGLHLRLTGQGPWDLAELQAIAASIA
jgi:hypothetical protein